MSEQLNQLKREYHEAFEEMMAFRAEMKKKEEDRKVLKLAHYLKKDLSPEDMAEFEKAKAEQEKLKEKYKDERQADAIKYAKLKARADTLSEQYEKLMAHEEKRREKNSDSRSRKKTNPQDKDAEEVAFDAGRVESPVKPTVKTWTKPLAVACCLIAAIAGIAILSSKSNHNENQDTGQGAIRTRKIITIEQAESYIGRTLKELCSEYGDYENLHPTQFDSRIGGGGVSCDRVGEGFWYDDFIVVRVYHYYDEQSKAEYDNAYKEYTERHGKAPTVYVDTIPEDEARAAGIIIKK